MSTKCVKCGTQFDSPCCPYCGTPAQSQMQPPPQPLPHNQLPPNQLPPNQLPPNQFPPHQLPPNSPNQFNQFPYQQPPKKRKSGCLVILLMVFGVLMFFAFIIFLVSINSDGDKPTAVNKESEGKITEVPEKNSFKVGETVELKDIQVTLVGISESRGGDFNKPDDGNVFALCEFNIENNSDKDIMVSSIICFETYCDDYSISQSISGLLEADGKSQLDGSVAAGKKMNGVIAYEIPKDWKELEINFTPDFWSSKDITFIATK